LRGERGGRRQRGRGVGEERAVKEDGEGGNGA